MPSGDWEDVMVEGKRGSFDGATFPEAHSKIRVAIFFPRLGGWHDQAYRGGSMRILGQDSHVSPVNREIKKQLR